jgi:ribosomal protein S27AE
VNKVSNLQKKCGNSSSVLMAEKKEFKVTYSEKLYPVKQEKIKDIQIVESA